MKISIVRIYPRFRGKGSMQFADFRLIRYPAILTIRLLIVYIGLLSFVGCGGAPTPVSSPSASAKDFSIALSPATITAIAGGSQSTFAVSTTAQNGFANAVMVTLSGLPAGATASTASPFSVPAGGSQTVTLSIPPTVSAGNFTLTASGTSAALTHSATLALTVDPGEDFSIATVPSTLTVTAGGSTSFAVSIAGQNGFSDSVAVTLSGLPAGVTTSPASPFIVPAGGSQAVTLSIPATVAAGNFTLTASGTSAALTHSASLALTVDPVADFNIVLSPAALTVNAGASNSYTVSITAQGGFTGSVAVTLAGLPAGATTSLASPFNVAAGSSQPVLVSVPATVFAGNFPLTVSGTFAALAHSAQLVLTVLGQMQVATWHYDNARTSANLWETVLTPSNVNSASFGKLFTQPVDGYVVGHPLYLPAVNIPGQGAHNVVYVATMHDSVYAFDADSATTPALWMTSIFTYSPAGATTVPATVAKNAGTTGWTELGIISTPVIDPATGTLYLVAETYENGKVVHRLHALDVTTGLEKFSGPTTITATYTLNGKTTTFTDLYQMNRPGLLLANSHIYIGFGSNSNNDYSQGWVLSYNASTLQQEGAYTTEPGQTLASIWQKGAGLSADSLGNIYAQTGEGPFTAGTNLSSSVLQLSQSGTTLALADWFTPYNQQYLSAHDLDLDDGVLILPDQPGPYPHELITGGKEGTIYVLNREI